MTQRNEAHPMTRRKLGGINIDVLWLMVILSGFLFFTSLIPIPPNDFWWHLKIGELIFQDGAIPTTNMFAWTLPDDQPFFFAAWLAELLFYGLYKAGGVALIIAMRTLLIGIGAWLIAGEARRQSISWRISALVTALLCLMITNNLPVRTQMWAWVPFIATYIVLKRYSEGNVDWRWLILCPVSMLVWVNVHGSFILGILLVGAFFTGEVIRKVLKQSHAMSWERLRTMGIFGVITSLAVLVNPRFLGIIKYTYTLLSDPPSQQLIEEWQSPTPQGLANISFFVGILIFIILLAVSRYRLSPTEIILAAGFLWLAWSGQRYVIWYGLVTTPILARLIKELPIRMPAFTTQKNWLNVVLAVLIFLPVIAVSPWLVERLPLPETYWEQVQRGSHAGPLLSTHTPVDAADYLNAHPGGVLYNEMGYGSYLTWAVPEMKVFIDPRVELFPYAQWMHYIQINNGVKYNEILAQYGAERILLDRKLQPALAESLIEDPLWKLEYEDSISQVWIKLPDR